MIIDYGEKKCPMCGDFGIEIEKKIFSCTKCELTFHKFGISGEVQGAEDINWN
jgi:ribosomal protein L37AE/L43A